MHAVSKKYADDVDEPTETLNARPGGGAGSSLLTTFEERIDEMLVSVREGATMWAAQLPEAGYLMCDDGVSFSLLQAYLLWRRAHSNKDQKQGGSRRTSTAAASAGSRIMVVLISEFI